jgi:thiol-disulfide isomerase/thioredoxin
MEQAGRQAARQADFMRIGMRFDGGGRMKRKWKKGLVELLIFLLVLFGIRAWQQRDIPEGPAPALQGTLLDGTSYVRPKGPVLVQFWGTWCPICRTEESSIEALSKKYGVVTVALKCGSDREVMNYMKSRGLDFKVVNDPDGLISSKWGVHAVPASFILDGSGRVRFAEFGYTSESGLKARLWLAKLFS